MQVKLNVFSVTDPGFPRGGGEESANLLFDQFVLKTECKRRRFDRWVGKGEDPPMDLVPDESFGSGCDGPAELRLVAGEVPGAHGSRYHHLVAGEHELYDPEHAKHVIPAPPHQRLVPLVLNKTTPVHFRCSCR